MNKLYNSSDYAIMGGKALASSTRNRTLQNTVDAFSLGNNAYGYMQASSRLSSLEAQSCSYGYRSYDVQREMDYYRRQRNKHLVLGIFDIISILCRICTKN